MLCSHGKILLNLLLIVQLQRACGAFLKINDFLLIGRFVPMLAIKPIYQLLVREKQDLEPASEESLARFLKFLHLGHIIQHKSIQNLLQPLLKVEKYVFIYKELSCQFIHPSSSRKSINREIKVPGPGRYE